jgi:hypothetical protein
VLAKTTPALSKTLPAHDDDNTLTMMTEMTLMSADGTKLAARRTGHGSPIVLVHGAVADVDTFALIEGLLTERHSGSSRSWSATPRAPKFRSDGFGREIVPSACSIDGSARRERPPNPSQQQIPRRIVLMLPAPT